MKSGSFRRWKSTAEREHAIQQIVSRAVASTEIVDIMKAAGLERPDISILSDEFLAEVRDSDKKNLAIEALKKLINGKVRSQAKPNVTQSKAFSERNGLVARRPGSQTKKSRSMMRWPRTRAPGR
jgi:type I site-specific restriction-modification system R (restriction) subunit